MRAPDTLVGKIVKCPGCATSVLIPAPAVPTPPPTRAPAPPPGAIVNRREEVRDEDEVADVLPADETDEVIEEIDEVEEETDDLEVVPDRPQPKRKKGQGVTQDERRTAMLLYVSALLFGFFGPLIIWLVKKGESRYIDHHGKSALNFILSVSVPAFLVGIASCGFSFLNVFTGIGALLLLIVVFLLLGLYYTVMLILFAGKAKNGDWSVLPAWLPVFG
jgi:uncharacterized Tic20 family protein